MDLSIKKLISTLALEWDISIITNVKDTDQGVVNINWILNTDNGKYILKQVEQTRKESNIHFEFDYLLYLKNTGFPYQIPVPVLNKRGKYLISKDNHYYWMYHYIEGETDVEMDNFRLKEVAKLLATYHNFVERSGLDNGILKQSDYENLGYNSWVLKETEDYLNKLKDQNEYLPEDDLLKLYGPQLIDITKKLETNKISSFPKYPLHRDIGGDNIVWKNNKLVGLLDFENVPIFNEPFIKDIAVTAMSLCRNKNNLYESDLEAIKVLLDEYRQYKSLKKEEISFLPEIITLGFVEDFNYAYWMLKHDPKRAKIERLHKYAKFALWQIENRKEIKKFLNYDN
ncbi:MAG: phosphotransferase [Candidatus Thorarchaeota archaeon]